MNICGCICLLGVLNLRKWLYVLVKRIKKSNIRLNSNGGRRENESALITNETLKQVESSLNEVEAITKW